MSDNRTFSRFPLTKGGIFKVTITTSNRNIKLGTNSLSNQDLMHKHMNFETRRVSRRLPTRYEEGRNL